MHYIKYYAPECNKNFFSSSAYYNYIPCHVSSLGLQDYLLPKVTHQLHGRKPAFVQAVKENALEHLKKLKVHLFLHLPQSMADFGPTSTFNTERCCYYYNYYSCCFDIL